MSIKNKQPRPKGRVIPSEKFVAGKVPTLSKHCFIPTLSSEIFAFVENKLYRACKKNQKGAVLLVASLLIMSVLLMIFFGVSFSLTKELKMFESLQKSPMAYCAADSGAERILYKIKEGYSPVSPYPVSIVSFSGFDNGSSYEVIAPSSTVFKSIGTIDDISRAIELSY